MRFPEKGSDLPRTERYSFESLPFLPHTSPHKCKPNRVNRAELPDSDIGRASFCTAQWPRHIDARSNAHPPVLRWLEGITGPTPERVWLPQCFLPSARGDAACCCNTNALMESPG